MQSGKSFMYNMNIMGLKTLPCGTPLMHVLKLDNAELICTLCFLSVRKDFIQFSKGP